MILPFHNSRLTNAINCVRISSSFILFFLECGISKFIKNRAKRINWCLREQVNIYVIRCFYTYRCQQFIFCYPNNQNTPVLENFFVYVQCTVRVRVYVIDISEFSKYADFDQDGFILFLCFSNLKNSTLCNKGTKVADYSRGWVTGPSERASVAKRGKGMIDFSPVLHNVLYFQLHCGHFIGLKF